MNDYLFEDSSSFHSNYHSIQNSPQFIKLSTLIEQIDSLNTKGEGINEVMASKLINTTNELIETLDDHEENPALSLITKSMRTAFLNSPKIVKESPDASRISKLERKLQKKETYIENLENKIVELENEINTAKSTPNECIDVIKDQIGSVFENQCNELIEMSRAKLALTVSSQKLLNMSNRIEKILDKKSELSEHGDYSDLIKDLKLILREKPEIMNILSNEKDTCHNRILQACSQLYDDRKTEEKEMLTLRNLIFSLVRFISLLMNNKSSQKIFVTHIREEEIENILISQYNRVIQFITSNSISMNDDQSLFDVLIEASDRQLNNEYIVSVLKDMFNQNISINDLKYSVVQLLIANDVLRKYAIEAKEKISSQAYEILQNASKSEIENSSIIQNPELEDHYQKLCYHNQELQEAIQYLENENDEIKFLLAREHKSKKKLGMKLNKKIEDIIKEKDNSLQELGEQLKNKESCISLKENELARLQQIQNKEQEEISILKSNFENQLVDLNSQIILLKKDNNSLFLSLKNYSKFSKINFEQIRVIQNTLKDVVSSFQNSIKSCYNSIKDQISSQIQGIVDYYIGEIYVLQQSNEEMQEQIVSQSEINDELSSRINNVIKQKSEIETQLAAEKKKTQSQYDLINQEKLLLERQLEMKQTMLLNQQKQQISMIQVENQKQNHEMMAKICRLFNTMVDISQPISWNSIESLLSRVRSSIENYQKQLYEYQKLDTDYQSLVKQLSQISSHKPSIALASLIRSSNELNNRILYLENEIKTLRQSKSLRDSMVTPTRLNSSLDFK